MKRAIIVGATSGIGRAVTTALLRQGWQVGIAGRREHLLNELEAEFRAENVVSEVMDVTRIAFEFPRVFVKVHGLSSLCQCPAFCGCHINFRLREQR